MAYQARVLFVCVANSARSQLAEAFHHTLHDIREGIKMFVRVKTKG